MQPQIDPITGMPVVAAQPAQQMTNMPPQQANAMGASQPVFSPRATQAGTGLFGDMQQRQNSVNAPLMFKKNDDAKKKIGMQQLPEITINGSKGNDMKFGSAAPDKGSGAHGDSKYEKATYQLMDEGSIDETSDANYGKILDRMKRNEDAEKYNTIEDGSAGNLSKIAGASPFNQERITPTTSFRERIINQGFKELKEMPQRAELIRQERPIGLGVKPMELETPQPPKTFREAPEKLEMIMNQPVQMEPYKEIVKQKKDKPEKANMLSKANMDFQRARIIKKEVMDKKHARKPMTQALKPKK